MKRMPVAKVDVPKVKPGQTEMVLKNSKITCGGGVI